MDYETPEKHQAAPSSATGSDLSLCSHDTQRRQKRHIFHKFVNITASSKSGEKISGIWVFFFSGVSSVSLVGAGKVAVAIKWTIGSLQNRMKCLCLAIMVMDVKKAR